MKIEYPFQSLWVASGGDYDFTLLSETELDGPLLFFFFFVSTFSLLRGRCGVKQHHSTVHRFAGMLVSHTPTDHSLKWLYPQHLQYNAILGRGGSGGLSLILIN